MHTVYLDYGDGKMPIEVPDDALVVRYGETYVDPPPVEDPVGAVRQALQNPLGSRRIGDRVKPGDKVVIAFPDRVKGGFGGPTLRRTALPLILEELDQAGIRPEDIKLICAEGLHRKNLLEEWYQYLPAEVVDRFKGKRLVNHDAEDPAGIVHLGEDELGDWVDVNRDVAEADLTILLGHTQGNPYGGFSGGYKMPATGLTTWRSIRCHHTPGSLYHHDFLPISTKSHFRDQLRHIGMAIEKGIGKPFFTVDAVIDSDSRILGVWAGATAEVEKASWDLAGRRTNVRLPLKEKVDVVVVGLPRTFHYGPGMGSNPILMMQAIGATVARVHGVLREGGVVIAASICDGWFNDDWFPAYREVYHLLQRVNGPQEMTRFEEQVANNPEYVYKYRHAYAYHPFHAFSMAYFGGIALRHTGAVIVIGAKEPGYARGMGCLTEPTFEAALRRAERYAGKNPRMLVLPEFLSKVPAHFFLEDATTGTAGRR